MGNHEIVFTILVDQYFGMIVEKEKVRSGEPSTIFIVLIDNLPIV